jgi:glycosyltransferase involved in cell wall biosynthesis
MHNITKIKLFRILLRITYLPSLILIYPFVFWRKKSSNGLFFFFDRYSLGGAQRIHLDILKSVADHEKQIYFTRFSPNDLFRDEFYKIPHSETRDIHIWCDNLLFRLFSVHYYSFYINRCDAGQIFGANSTFFYDMLPFISNRIIKTELLHNFTFGKSGMEFFGLTNVRLLTNRIIYDQFTLENIEKQYNNFQIDPIYLKRLHFIEPGVDIPPEETKTFDTPLKIICAGRGGPQKRIWLVNKIAEYCIDHDLPVHFHFAGTLIKELSDKVRTHAVLHGEISDPDKMGALLSNSDIALLTSLYEGFPMFIKESMAHGCIPIVTALPGNLMHLEDGKNSLLISAITDEAMVIEEAIEKIKKLITNKDLCLQISMESYQYAKTHFDRNKFNEAFRQLLL